MKGSRGFRIVLLSIVCIGFATAKSTAQGPDQSAAHIAAMSRLGYLEGNWQGEGWTLNAEGKREPFRGGEVIQRKLGGVALLVEGSFFGRPPGTDRDVPVHTTLGVIAYDVEAKTYRFSTWLATGTSGVRELTVTTEGWGWEIRTPQGVIRYNMTLTPTGEWLEVGNRSRDGKNWQLFFEMRLRKAPAD
jgi:hypothetical protein